MDVVESLSRKTRPCGSFPLDDQFRCHEPALSSLWTPLSKPASAGWGVCDLSTLCSERTHHRFWQRPVALGGFSASEKTGDPAASGGSASPGLGWWHEYAACDASAGAVQSALAPGTSGDAAFWSDGSVLFPFCRNAGAPGLAGCFAFHGCGTASRGSSCACFQFSGGGSTSTQSRPAANAASSSACGGVCALGAARL